MEGIKIVSTDEEYDVYGGRAAQGHRDIKNTEPWDDGWLGNPYKMGPTQRYKRVEIVSMYRGAFRLRLLNDESFKDAIEELRGKTVGCPHYEEGEPCHLEIINEYLRNELFGELTDESTND